MIELSFNSCYLLFIQLHLRMCKVICLSLRWGRLARVVRFIRKATVAQVAEQVKAGSLYQGVRTHSLLQFVTYWAAQPQTGQSTHAVPCHSHRFKVDLLPS